jgi:P-type Mg2+ transporter
MAPIQVLTNNLLYDFSQVPIPADTVDDEQVSLFQSGWFVESLMTQTFIIHVIRTNRIPFLQSRASLPLTLTTLSI